MSKTKTKKSADRRLLPEFQARVTFQTRVESITTGVSTWIELAFSFDSAISADHARGVGRQEIGKQLTALGLRVADGFALDLADERYYGTTDEGYGEEAFEEHRQGWHEGLTARGLTVPRDNVRAIEIYQSRRSAAAGKKDKTMKTNEIEWAAEHGLVGPSRKVFRRHEVTGVNGREVRPGVDPLFVTGYNQLWHGYALQGSCDQHDTDIAVQPLDAPDRLPAGGCASSPLESGRIYVGQISATRG
jgi:hypothetical protein